MESHNFLKVFFILLVLKFCLVVWFCHYVVTFCHDVTRFDEGYVLCFDRDVLRSCFDVLCLHFMW